MNITHTTYNEAETVTLQPRHQKIKGKSAYIKRSVDRSIGGNVLIEAGVQAIVWLNESE